jgi:hypothetical protein
MLKDMKCSNCGNDMVRSRAGWLCLSCGHIENDSTADSTATAAIALGKEGHNAFLNTSVAEPASTTATTPTATTAQSAPSDQPVPSDQPSPADDKPTAEPEATAKPDVDKPDLEEIEKVVKEAEEAVTKNKDEVEPNSEPEAEADSKPEAEPPTLEKVESELLKATEAVASPEPTPAEPAADEPASDKSSVTDEPRMPQSESAPAAEPAPEAKPETKPPIADEPKASAPVTVPVILAPSLGTEKPEANAEKPPESKADPAGSPAADQAARGVSASAVHAGRLSHFAPTPASEQPARPADTQAPTEPEKPASQDPVPMLQQAAPPPTSPLKDETGAIAITAPVDGTQEPEDGQPATPAAGTVVAPGIPVSSQPAVTPTTHPRPVSALRAVKILAVVVVLAIIGLVAYFFLWAPGGVLAGYLTRVSTAKTSTYAATLDTESTDSGEHLAVSVNGSYDLSNQNTPKLDMSITGKVSAGAGIVSRGGSSGSLAGHIITTDNVLYFQIQSLSFLSDLLPVKISKDWYKYDLGKSNDDKCLKSGKSSGSVLGSQIMTKIPVKNAKFLGPDSFNGTSALHYSGTVDNSKLQAAIDNANKGLSADCKIDVSADDFKNLSITYEIWRGLSKDRLKLSVADSHDKTNASMTFDTGAYNKPVSIKAPAGAKDASQLIKDLEASAGPQDSAADVTRQSDLAQLSSLAEQYSSNHRGAYPATALILSKQGFSKTDPTTKKAYQIVGTRPTAVGQIEYMLSAKCDANNITAMVVSPANNRAYALVTMLDGGDTVCIDNGVVLGAHTQPKVEKPAIDWKAVQDRLRNLVHF